MGFTSIFELEDMAYSAADKAGIFTADMEKLDEFINSRAEGTAGEAIAEYEAVYLESDGKFDLAMADGTQQPCLGLAIEAAVLDDTFRYQRTGPMINAGWAWGTIGAKVYLDAGTPGDLTDSIPASNAQIIGIVLSATSIYITISMTGTIQFASDAETIAGTISDKANTPESLKAKLGTQTDHGVLIGSGTTGAITALGVATNGQLLIGSTGADPALQAISAGEAITITNGAGSITIACEDATDANKGVAELATNAECVTGTDTVRTVTPDGLTARLEAPGAIGGTTPAAATFTGIDLTGLTDSYVPYVGVGALADSPIRTDGTYVGIGIAPQAGILLYLRGQTAGTTVKTIIDNGEEFNAASHANLHITTNSATGGDPYISYSNRVLNWSAGIDNSDGDKYQICENLTLGTNPRISITPSTGYVGFGTASPDRKIHGEHASALTNTVQQVARLTHITSDTPANGIGVGLEFEQETTVGNNEIIATIEAICTDVTAASEEGALSLKIMVAGAAATEALRVDSNVAATETRLLIYDVDNATVERVSVGAAGSGGGAFKLLRIPN